MSQQGAALQNYNNELVKCIEELCQKREELCRQIQQEEDEKQRLQNEVRQLTEKLARVNENLARKIASRNEFDRTIAETEAAYLKVGLTPWGYWANPPELHPTTCTSLSHEYRNTNRLVLSE
ncbi:microtubule nucleation factor SSNA1 isoform X1 [Monodelphis domestica]|uniref:microtubule nucleation factor SSNA1 isoform X1 n=1 Tax=Monodelphis domestica TaxID=13616 RepID=UPI0024E1FC6F|nr:microtubule nucleation factor SSNA1 isoform X1 [Monodelphis domestica]